MSRAAATVLLGILGLHSGDARAQAAVVDMTKAESGNRVSFSAIAGVVELADGRIVVHDPIDAEVRIVERDLSGSKQLVRSGSGPSEAMIAYRLVADGLGGVLIVDRVGSRVIEVDAAGRVSGQWREAGGRTCLGSARTTTIRFVLADGRFFTQGPPIATRTNGVREAVPETAIERWRNRCEADTLATTPFRLPANPVVIGNSVAGSGTSRLAPEPFEPSTEWAVDARGRVAILTPFPYQLRVVEEGRTTSIHTLTATRVAVSADHRRAWLEEQRAPRPATIITRGGRASSSMQREAIEEPRNWPAVLPPFLAGATTISPLGDVWIRRTVEFGKPSLYDVVNLDSGLIAQVRFERNARVVAVTRTHVLLALSDEDDLQTLERRTLPAPVAR
ncbi:MAG: hypothetical protein KF709_08035 [Gemmatimonadaceae bacterium]|nr:hypothetical protein [Gemmatimonadaceae bacterium]